MSNTCHVCGADCFETPLYRDNPIGEVPALWACEEHVTREVNPEEKELVDIIHKGE